MAHPQRKLLKNNPKLEKDYHYTNLVALAGADTSNLFHDTHYKQRHKSNPAKLHGDNSRPPAGM